MTQLRQAACFWEAFPILLFSLLGNSNKNNKLIKAMITISTMIITIMILMPIT